MAATDAVERGFQDWRAKNEDRPDMVDVIALLEVRPREDGGACVHLLLGSFDEAHAVIPAHGVSEAVAVSAPAVRMLPWRDAVNRYSHEHGVSTLGELLTYAAEAYVECFAQDDCDDCLDSGDNVSFDGESEDDDFDGDGGLDGDGIDDAAFTTDWEVEIARNKKRWLQKEEQLRSSLAKKPRKSGVADEAEAGAAGPADEGAAVAALDAPYGGPSAADRKQAGVMFTGSAASAVLVNDLIMIMEGEDRLGFSATPVEDNIYKWIVKLKGFDAGSLIATDLAELNERYGYNYLELQFDFAIDLFPCFPPQLTVVRPRLTPVMLQRISSLEFFKLSYWNPANDMCTVIQKVRSSLEEWCRLEPLHDMNDRAAHPSGSFYQIEHILLRLAHVSEMKPRANLEYAIEAQPAPRLRVKKADGEDESKLWARGTGYGHGRRNRKGGWDPKQLQAARQENDAREERLVEEILHLVTEILADDSKLEGLKIGDILESSCLIPYLESYAKSDSIFEMAQHANLYCSILDIVHMLCTHKSLEYLAMHLPNQTVSLGSLLRTQSALAAKFKTRLGSHAGIDRSGEDAVRVADRIIAVVAKLPVENLKVEATAKQPSEARAGKQAAKAGAAAAPAAPAGEEAAYVAALGGLQLDEMEIIDTDVPFHYKPTAKQTSPTPSAVLRLAQEVTSLGTSLPINLSSSVFLRIDEDRIDIMKALIIGPEGTPYSGGCFEFDIWFPSTYPASAPKVNLQTTGFGSVRFNPNLYNCGKVCLSLLGTWEGQEGESWLPESSTLLQVLVSIQSLILVPDPWFNEPGYENQMHTEKGKRHSAMYNQGLRASTMRWAMINQLKNPSKGFEDVIHEHFTLRSKALLAQCADWVKAAEKYDVNSVAGENMAGESMKTQPGHMKVLLSDLTKQINKLIAKGGKAK